MKISTIMRTVQKCKNKVSQGILWCGVSFYTQLAYAGSDPLSGVIEENISPALGTDSTFFKLLCLAEILTALGVYLKTKSYGVLAGVVVVGLFFTIAYVHYVG